MENKKIFSNPLVIAGLLGVGLLCCCGVIVAAGLGSAAWYIVEQPEPIVEITAEYILPIVEETPTPRPTLAFTDTPPTEAPTETSADTLTTLEDTLVPISDLLELACRLQAQCNIPAALPAPARPLQVGARQTFWVHDSNTDEYVQIEAQLEYVTEHSYFWIERGAEFNSADLQKLAETFEQKIYPTNRVFFGSEAMPGVDNDQHIYVVFVKDLGTNVAGYFSSADANNPAIRKYSNGHEMFLFDLGSVSLKKQFAYSVLAHEFQHMIHAHQDRNEETWMNEGFADLAALLNGYQGNGSDWVFSQDSDVQLNDWPNDPDDPYADTPHYGASFLSMTYLLDRFGETFTQAVVRNPRNGLDSLDDTFRALNITDPLTGRPVTADDFFADWTIANYLMDGSVGDGRFIYNNYPAAPQTAPTEVVSTCPAQPLTRSVHQYGTDYILFECAGAFTLHFTGAGQTNLLPTEAASGRHTFWSNKGDESDMTLTRQFDLGRVSGPVTLEYSVWYDLETGYDYVYVEASRDGTTWELLKTPSGTDSDPVGNSYGWGYTGQSNGWMQESVDLSAFAGGPVWIRFEYITDSAVNGEGFLLDDLAIPAINYRTDFETADGAWEARGFARVDNVLPQTFRVTLITRGAETTVQYISLNPDLTANIPVNLGRGDEAILVISGTTRFTRSRAYYSVSFK